MRVESFPPVATPAARVLVLGSMPGVASLTAGRYYAHPRNQFWPLMGLLVGAGPELDYPARLARVNDAGIALWDVLQACDRHGSLDTAIRPESVQVNDFAALLQSCPGITDVLFNGSMAARSFERLVLPALGDTALRLHRLPSTSPAHAGMRLAEKFARWRAALQEAGLGAVLLP